MQVHIASPLGAEQRTNSAHSGDPANHKKKATKNIVGKMGKFKGKKKGQSNAPFSTNS
jgi:hypothetical protein